MALGLVASGASASPESTQASGLCHDDPSRTPSTLTHLVCSLRDGLPKLARETVVVSRPLAEGNAEGARVFGERLTMLLSSATGTHNGGVSVGAVPNVANPTPKGGAVDPATTQSVSSALLSDGRPLLLLEPKLQGGEVQINATLVGKRANVWARAKGETNQILAHAFISKTIDAEVRSYLPKVPLVQPKLQVYATPLSQVNAIACGHMNDDGTLDVAITNRQEVAWGAITSDGFVPTRTEPLSSLSPVAPVPLREPLASLWFRDNTLEVSSTDRHFWLQLDPQLHVISKRPNQWGVAPGLCASRTTLPPRAEPFPCHTPPSLQDATSPYLDRQVVFEGDGRAPRANAWRDAGSGTITVHTASRTWSLPERGAQLIIDDLNHDGILEVMSTSPTLSRQEDRLWVHSLSPSSNEPVLVWDVPVPSGIDAIAVCPPDAAQQSTLLIASNQYIGVLL